MDDCVFCKIIHGEAPARKVYEDEFVCAFWDARPTAPIHILIVPKKHISTFNDLPDDDTLLNHFGFVAKRIARMFDVYETGYRFLINVNKDGGQRVFHLHAHLVAGKDLGTHLLNGAIIGASIWRSLLGRFRRS